MANKRDSGKDFTSKQRESLYEEHRKSLDDYTAGIDLLNACRRFYVTRLSIAERHKASLRGEDTSDSGRSTMDRASWHRQEGAVVGPGLALAVRFLKSEIACLIEQDLQLMKQLLMLYEQIEELKWQRKFLDYRQRSPTESGSGVSGGIQQEDGRFSVVYSSSDDDSQSTILSPPKYPTPSNLSMYSAETRCSDESEYDTPRQSPSQASLLQDSSDSQCSMYSCHILPENSPLLNSKQSKPDNQSKQRKQLNNGSDTQLKQAPNSSIRYKTEIRARIT